MNNSSYYLIADSIVNTYLIQHCEIQPFLHPSTSASPSSASSPQKSDGPSPSSKDPIGLVISSDATYFAPTSFPATLQVGLRVVKLGTSSVKYEVGIWEKESSQDQIPAAAVVTHATHVFVDRISRRSVKAMPQALRTGLEKLVVSSSESKL